VPSPGVGERAEALGRVCVRFAQVEGDARRPHAEGAHCWRGGSRPECPAQHGVGGLERAECGDAVEALHQGRSVDRLLRARRGGQFAGEGLRPPASGGLTRQCRGGERAQAERHQLGQVAVRTARCLDVARSARSDRYPVARGAWLEGSVAVPFAPRLGRQVQAPPRQQLVRIDEARTVGHRAAEVEPGDGRPRRPVVELGRGDAPQRLSGTHHVRREPRGRSRSRNRNRHRSRNERRSRRRRGDPGRCAGRGSGPGGRREGRRGSYAHQGEHAHGDASPHAIDERGAGGRSHFTAAHVDPDGPQQLGAARHPRHPCRQRQHAHGVAGEGRPRVSEPTPQRVAHDNEQCCGYAHESEHGRQDRSGDVEERTPRPCPLLLTHRPVRS